MLPENCFVLSSDQAPFLTQSELFGYGLTDDAIIFGSSGLNEYLRANPDSEMPKEGRFAGIFISEREIRIRADVTGQELIYFFRDQDKWVVSNSFLLVAERASKIRKLSIYSPSVTAFNLKGGVHIGEQLISHRTMIENINVLPINAEIVVDRSTNNISVRTRDYLSVFDFVNAQTYKDCFIDVLERGSGILSALAEMGIPMNLFLSGGYDSRLVLCMLMASRKNDQLRVTSHPAKVDDFKVAQSLCEHLNLKLNQDSPPKLSRISGSDAVRMYLLSCGGTYLPFYPVHDFGLQHGAELRLTGDQPTGWSHFAGRARFNGNADKIANDILIDLKERGGGDAVREDFLTTFDILEIERGHPAAMLAHYNAVRGRYHCGRNWYKSLGSQFLFTPLMQSSFVALDLHNSKSGFHPTKFFADAFSAFGGWALDEPFETPDRAFAHELLSESPFKGGVEIEPRKMRVYGRIGDALEVQQSNMFSVPLNLDAKDDSIKDLLTTLFYRAHDARESGLFMPEDFAKANGEIHAKGSLSHGYRKVSHIISSDVALRIVNESANRFERLHN